MLEFELAAALRDQIIELREKMPKSEGLYERRSGIQ